MKSGGWLIVGLVVLLAMGGGGYVMLKDTRGFRNNNPGNLRYSAAFQWQGQVGQDPDGYLIFDTMENGVRAMVKNLRTYLGRGVNTIARIIPTWAPASENPTAAYVSFVESKTGIPRDTVIGDGQLPAVVSAIIEFENGGGLSAKVLSEGVRLAYLG